MAFSKLACTSYNDNKIYNHKSSSCFRYVANQMLDSHEICSNENFLIFKLKKMKSLSLASVALASGIENVSPFTGYELNEECPNNEGVDKCEADCVMIWQKCLQVCNNDYACVTTCNRQLNDCTESCPCHGDCYWGCPCDNPYCECKNRPTNVYVYNICKEIANSDYLYCSNQCVDDIDIDCDLACVNQLMADFQNCPCGVRCIDGCPCRNFDCDSNAPPSTTPGTGTTTHRTTPTTTTTAPPTVSTWPEDSDSIHMLIFNPLQSNSDVEPQASQIKFSWNLDDIPGISCTYPVI